MASQYLTTFAQNLKYLIGETSLREFSKRVGIPQPTLSRYLACKREITLENLIRIADYFHEDIDYLIGRKSY